MMSSRTESRREVLEEAHEGHEEYHPKVHVKRIGVRRWFSTSEGGYGYWETMRNWDMSNAQLAGLLAMLAGLVAIALCIVYLV